MIARWWHRHHGHRQVWVRVSAPMWDPSAKGYLIKCDCGKNWAL